MSKESTISQIKNMARFSRIQVNQAEIDVYVARREAGGSLSDQRLFAQIIAETNPSNVTSIWRAYENIFAEELQLIDEPAAA